VPRVTIAEGCISTGPDRCFYLAAAIGEAVALPLVGSFEF
jgi:hypothetical protein